MKLPRLVQQADLDKVEKILDGFIRDLGLEVFAADQLALDTEGKVDLFQESMEIVRRAWPVKTRDSRGERAMAIGGADALHCALARRTGCKYFATFDQGFRGLKERIEPLILQDRYLKWSSKSRRKAGMSTNLVTYPF